MSRLQLMSEINDLNHLDDQVPVETDDEKKKIPRCRNSSKIEFLLRSLSIVSCSLSIFGFGIHLVSSNLFCRLPDPYPRLGVSHATSSNAG
jgi:hypothetical protein